MTLPVWTLIAFLVLVASDAIMLFQEESVTKNKETFQRKRSAGRCRMDGRRYQSGDEFTGQSSMRCERLQCVDGHVILVEKYCKASGNRCFRVGETFNTTSLGYSWSRCTCEENGFRVTCWDGQRVDRRYSR